MTENNVTIDFQWILVSCVSIFFWLFGFELKEEDEDEDQGWRVVSG